MNDLVVQTIELDLDVLSPLGLGRHVGSALRGALFESLRSNLNVCMYKHLPSCQPCSLRQVCPLSGVLATVDDDAARGHDVPRPMAIRSPIDERRLYEEGSRIQFGITLFGSGTRYVPYLVLAARELERSGLGLRLGAARREPPERGAVRLGRVESVHPFTGARDVIREAGSDVVRPSDLVVTARDIESFAAMLPTDALTIELLTPMRLVDGGKLVRPLRFDALVRRLSDRIESLTRHYAGTPWIADSHDMAERAGQVEVAHDATRWVDLDSHSSRTGRWSPNGGYVGCISFRGELSPFLPLLVWGTLVHVGKSATRGNGYYRLTKPMEVGM